jgi:hypothetical protein
MNAIASPYASHVLAVSALVVSLVAGAVSRPRDCPNCGVYAGPNVARVLDPYLRQAGVWPEFYSSTCQFEVARGAFVTLTRTACASEASYRLSRGVR